ncbi:MAG: tetratricopeptide repeat protein [Verrucomicrobiota bacterium]|nr:tetratricopeptide repeat protein [Verrucomicrobiota bacterium]
MKPATPATPQSDSKPTKALKVTKEVDASTLPPDADFEDRFFEFWKKSGSTVIVAVIVVSVAVLGYQTTRYFMQKQAEAVSAEFGKATDAASLQSFANEHPNHELTGLAHFRLGNYSFEAGKYADAVTQYEQAISILGSSPFAQRASIAKGVAQIRNGQVDAGLASLTAVADDTTAFDSSRAEAAYTAAICQIEKGDIPSARIALKKIEVLKQSGAWGQRANELKDRERQLVEVK